MRRGILTLLGAVALGICMFLCTRVLLWKADAEPMPVEHGSRLPELGWLRHWLDLDEGQMDRVKALHVTYLPRCEELCSRVHEADEAVLALGSARSKVDGDFIAALQSRTALTAECQQALLQHIYDTAACLRPEQARRYLDHMIPHALGLRGHEAPPSSTR